MALFGNAKTWNTVRRGAINRLTREDDRVQYVDSLCRILHDSVLRVSRRVEKAS